MMLRLFVFLLVLSGCASMHNSHHKKIGHNSRVWSMSSDEFEDIHHKKHDLDFHKDKIQVRAEHKIDLPDLIWPTSGVLTSPFGVRTLQRRTRMHFGIDIAAGVGTPVYAAATGRVVFSGSKKGYGKAIVLKHDDVHETLYGHLSHRVVGANQIVHRNQLIGYIGRTGRVTGANLHFELRVNGVPEDPLLFLPGYVTGNSRVRVGESIPPNNPNVARYSIENDENT